MILDSEEECSEDTQVLRKGGCGEVHELSLPSWHLLWAVLLTQSGRTRTRDVHLLGS